MSSNQIRQCVLQTSTNRIVFHITCPQGRLNDSKRLVNVIDMNNRKVSNQDDGTGASKLISRVLNSTLKRQGWFTIKSTPFPTTNYLHFFKVGNDTYCNAYKIKSYMTGPIMLGLIATMKTKSQEEIDKYISKCMDSVPEVLACMTNNLKYKYYNRGERETSLLKIDIISSSEVAIQLYEGCWIPMKQTTFRTLYSAGGDRVNKYTFISPEELYFKCTGEHLTDVQIKLMYAYLLQNTSEKLVTQRSLELLNELPKMFPTRINKLIVKNNPQARDSTHVIMMVRGNLLDWSISGYITGNNQVGRQSVNSHMCVSLKNYELHIQDSDGNTMVTLDVEGYSTLKENLNEDTYFALEPKKGCIGIGTIKRLNSAYFCEKSDEIFYFTGSICIDQQNTDVSIGDQFTSRAMAFLNDTASFDRVSTMRSYKRTVLPDRVDINAMFELQPFTLPKE